MTGQLQAFLDTSEDFRKKSGKLAQSIEINSVLLSDNSTEKAGQRNTVLSKLCRQAAEAKEAGGNTFFAEGAGTGAGPPVRISERNAPIQRAGERG